MYIDQVTSTFTALMMFIVTALGWVIVIVSRREAVDGAMSFIGLLSGIFTAVAVSQIFVAEWFPTQFLWALASISNALLFLSSIRLVIFLDSKRGEKYREEVRARHEFDRRAREGSADFARRAEATAPAFVEMMAETRSRPLPPERLKKP